MMDVKIAPGAIRTRDLQIRNLLLYPTELQAHNTIYQHDNSLKKSLTIDTVDIFMLKHSILLQEYAIFFKENWKQESEY